MNVKKFNARYKTHHFLQINAKKAYVITLVGLSEKHGYSFAVFDEKLLNPYSLSHLLISSKMQDYWKMHLLIPSKLRAMGPKQFNDEKYAELIETLNKDDARLFLMIGVNEKDEYIFSAPEDYLITPESLSLILKILSDVLRERNSFKVKPDM